ncbi:MAG TPA: lipocalin family protein [Bacteroidales bacterium]|nr:lipocalin family protein [Bacteroidales bacterium]
MKKSVRIYIPVLITIILFSACKQKQNQQQSPAEESFLGEWYTIRGDMEAYSFLKDENSYIFTGTQEMRPVIYGKWKIENDKFIIIMDNGTTTEYSYELKNDTLTLNNGAEIYTRTEPFEIKHPEVRILINIASDFNSLDFSPPEPAEIKWGYYVDSSQTYKEFSIQGFSITAATVLPSDEISDLNNYIRDYGFESDTILVTEICSGYWDADHIVTLCTSQDPEAENDSVYINISSGVVIK